MPDLIEATRRSKVTFAASKERGRQMIEPRSMYLDGLQRIREPVSRSKAGVQGKVADVANGRSRHAESQNELKAFRVLMATARSDVWQEQPFVLEYQHEEARHRYTPDILIAWGAHQEVVEIKEDSEAESLENQTRFALIGSSWPSTALVFGCGRNPRFALNLGWRTLPSSCATAPWWCRPRGAKRSDECFH